MNTDIKLEVPTNVKTRIEFFNGFGLNELKSTMIALLISIPIGILVNIVFRNLFISILTIFIIVSATVIFTMKDNHNQSVSIMIMNLIKFLKEQKKYKYKRLDT